MSASAIANASGVKELEGAYPRGCLDHLLDTAAVQFAQFGVDGISIRDIGREAGLKAPSICYHFNSKDNLYREAVAHKLEQTIDLIDARIRKEPDRRQRFRVLVEAFFDLFVNDRDILVLMQRDVIDAGLNHRPFLCKDQFVHFTSLVRRLASDHAECDIGEATAFTVSAMIFGYCELMMAVRNEPANEASRDAAKAHRARLVEAAVSLVNLHAGL